MTRIVFFLLFSIFTSEVTAQFMFRRTYGLGSINEGRCVIQSSDNGYVVCGSTTPYSGGQTDFYLLKTDSTGIPEYQKSFGSPGIDQSFALVQLPDSGFLLAGYSNGYSSNNDYDAALIRTDKNGNSLWIKTFGTGNWDFIYDIKPTPDGNFILAGNSYGSGNGFSSGYIVKVDTGGNVLWHRFIEQNQQVILKQIAVRSNGSFVVCGNVSPTVSYPADYFIALLNTQGDTTQTKIINNGRHESFNAIGLFSNGDFALAGNSIDSAQQNNMDEVIARLDTNLNVAWLNVTPKPDYDDCNDLIVYNDTLVTVGSTTSDGNGGYDFHIVFYYSNGAWISPKANTYGKSENEYCYHIQYTNDKGFILVGTSTSMGPGQQSIFLVKSDSILSFDSNVTIDVRETNDKIHFDVYPNPSSGILTVHSKISRNDMIVKLYTAEGRLVNQMNHVEFPFSFSIEHLMNGVYFLDIISDKFIEKKMFLKQ